MFSCLVCVVTAATHTTFIWTCGATGDTHPLNHVERSVACGVLILASVVYAVIFGSVAVQISEFDKSGVRLTHTHMHIYNEHAWTSLQLPHTLHGV